jgi:hypothetical protein
LIVRIHERQFQEDADYRSIQNKLFFWSLESPGQEEFFIMNFNHMSFCAAIIGSACAGVPFEAQQPRPVPEAVQARGEQIYVGRVFPLADGASSPTYVYERRVQRQTDGQVSTHITREPTGVIALAESATETADHRLLEYTLHTNQLGQRGSIRVEGDQLVFHMEGPEGERTGTEEPSGPVAVGPTLVGFVMRHLPVLRNGTVVGVRLAVLDRLETIGFDLEAVESESPDATTRVMMTPTNFVYSLAIDPIYFTFDRSTNQLLRLEGRVPPKVRSESGWQDFDARVEYRLTAAEYR